MRKSEDDRRTAGRNFDDVVTAPSCGSSDEGTLASSAPLATNSVAAARSGAR